MASKFCIFAAEIPPLKHIPSPDMKQCPCGSGSLYADCCGPVIYSRSAPTAAVLMKSRYTAYYIGDVDYLCATARNQKQDAYTRAEIERWSKENIWTGLEIISCQQGGMNDTVGTVEFKAHFKDADGVSQTHYERSRFMKENGSWFYVDGVFEPKKTITAPKTERNAPCPCGSGKKYKNCCL